MILLPFVPLLGLLAFAAAIWTAIDAAKRGQNWFAWSVAVAITGLAFIVWLVVGFVSTTVYLIVTAGQFTVAERREETP